MHFELFKLEILNLNSAIEPRTPELKCWTDEKKELPGLSLDDDWYFKQDTLLESELQAQVLLTVDVAYIGALLTITPFL